jgi:CheY-like chemotaxis protein
MSPPLHHDDAVMTRGGDQQASSTTLIHHHQQLQKTAQLLGSATPTHKRIPQHDGGGLVPEEQMGSSSVIRRPSPVIVVGSTSTSDGKAKRALPPAVFTPRGHEAGRRASTQENSSVLRLYYLKGARIEHDFEPGELAERMQSVAASRLPQGTTCLVDVASDAISASYDMCFRKTKYDVIFIDEMLEGGMAGNVFAEHFRKLGMWNPKLVMIVEDVRCVDESSLLKHGFDACISRPKFVAAGPDSVRKQWNLQPLFDCTLTLLRGAMMQGAYEPPASEILPARGTLRVTAQLSPRKSKKIKYTPGMDTPRLDGRNLFLDDFSFDDTTTTTPLNVSKWCSVVNFRDNMEELPLTPLPEMHNTNVNRIVAV